MWRRGIVELVNFAGILFYIVLLGLSVRIRMELGVLVLCEPQSL